MKLYLDNSFLNRPFDDPAIKLNGLEAEILFWIIEMVVQHKLDLVHSAIIAYENSLNPSTERKLFVEEIMRLSTIYQNLDDAIRQRASQVQEETGITSIDALHIAAAESSQADVFISCDYSLLKKYKQENGIIAAAQPLTFIQQYYENNR